jgi:hypothetical protein
MKLYFETGFVTSSKLNGLLHTFKSGNKILFFTRTTLYDMHGTESYNYLRFFQPWYWYSLSSCPSVISEPFAFSCLSSSSYHQSCVVCLRCKYLVEKVSLSLIFVWPCIIDTNNIDNQVDATIMVY